MVTGSERGLVEAGAEIDVDVVQADRLVADQRLAGLRLRQGHLLPHQFLGAAGLMDADGVVHDRRLPPWRAAADRRRAWCSRSQQVALGSRSLAAGIAAQGPVGRDHAVAGDQDRDRVAPLAWPIARAARQPISRPISRVAAGLARRDGAQRVPDAPLEGGALRAPAAGRRWCGARRNSPAAGRAPGAAAASRSRWSRPRPSPARRSRRPPRRR